MIGRVIAIWALMWVAATALAAIDVHEFETEAQRERFQSLTHQLRCPKCQNQAISDSDAQISRDMRDRVAEMIRAGKSDEQIINYFVSRYGAFVNYKPPVTAETLLLWGGPGLVFLAGILLVFWQLRRAARAAEREE